jgi:hypothetical protein
MALDIPSILVDRENYSLSNCVLGFFLSGKSNDKNFIKDEIVAPS